MKKGILIILLLTALVPVLALIPFDAAYAGDSGIPMVNPNTGKEFPADFKFDPTDGTPLVRKTGMIMVNPKTGMEFPADFKFDPADGTPLAPKDGKEMKTTVDQKTAPMPETKKEAEPAKKAEKAEKAAEVKTETAKEPEDAPGLYVTVITPMSSVYTIMQNDLVVTLKGPYDEKQVMPYVRTATSKTFVFKGIPNGGYNVTAVYGNQKANETVTYNGGAVELELVIY